MLAFTLRRAIQAIGVMIAVGIISFSMFRFAGDPVNQIVSIDTSAAERAEIRKSLGLDDPVPVQFARYFVNAAQFKFGVSYQFRLPVADLLKERMPATLELATCATILAMVFGILMGVYSALKRDTLSGENIPGGFADRNFAADLSDRHSPDLSVRGDAGLAAVVRPRRCGAARLVDHGAAHGLRPEGPDHALDHARPVPDDADHAAGAGRDARGACAPTISGLRGRADLTTRAIHFGHALKNTLVPVITVAGLQFGSVIAFAIITETVFQWPGMGLLFVQAVQNVDIPIMAAYLLMVSLIFVTINLVVDILYTVVDPRLRSTIGRPA